MPLFTRLQSVCTFIKCVKLNLVKMRSFHSLSKIPNRSPQAGTRSFFMKLFKKASKSDLKEADDVPDAFTLIYRNTMSHYILGGQIVSVVTGSVVLLALCFKGSYQERGRENVQWSSTAKPSENEELVYITIFIALLVAMQVMVSRTPVRMYKVPHTNKYFAVNYGHYFFLKEKYSFRRGEISRGKAGGILPWSESRYVIQTKTDRRPVLLVEHFFRRPADLSIMLGEQKDPDLEVEDVKVK